MADEDKNNDTGADKKPEGGNEFQPITSQEEFDKALSKRLDRERSKFADYDDLKQKASEYDQLQESQKSELQKERERAEAAEKRASAAERTALVTRIASEEDVIPEVLHGDTEEEMRAAAARIKEWRDTGKRQAPKPKSLKSGSGSDPRDGESGRAAAALRSLRQG